MAKTRRFSRLTTKMLLVTVVTGLLALVCAVGFIALGNHLVDRVYCSPGRTEARLKEASDSFRQYVEENSVGVKEAEKIAQWNRYHPDVKLSIFANGAVIYSDRHGAELILLDSGLVYRTENDSKTTTYTVNFYDGSFLVQIQDLSQERLYQLSGIVAVVLGVAVFLTFILLYHRHVTRTISRLAHQVRTVMEGDMNLEIRPTSKDEIGDLAMDVDGMRRSVLDRLRREEEAWNANSQLIGAISHDVRTPLTTLLGFLEILESQPDLPEDKRRAYLTLCGNKARTLRELTDKLFAYTMLFGKPRPDTHLEVFQAEPLLEQMLWEHTAELDLQGTQVDVRVQCPEIWIRVDAQNLNRIFGNLFSNIQKYADPAGPIGAEARWTGQWLEVQLENRVRQNQPAVESTKIGLRSCEKLLEAMEGQFHYGQEGDRFLVTLRFPPVPRESQ